MWSRNMELTELLLTNTDVIGGKRAPNPRTPRHYDNGGKMPCNLEAETIANSAGETAQLSIVAQPSIRFLNTKYYSNGSPTEDTEDCLGRITVGLTRSKSLTLLVSPLDMMGLMGMAQVIATIAYGIRGLRRETKSKVGTAHRPGSFRRRMKIPMGFDR